MMTLPTGEWMLPPPVHHAERAAAIYESGRYLFSIYIYLSSCLPRDICGIKWLDLGLILHSS